MTHPERKTAIDQAIRLSRNVVITCTLGLTAALMGQALLSPSGASAESASTVHTAAHPATTPAPDTTPVLASTTRARS